ncbi:broad-complex core protein isoform X1 [Stomoxys calcitrans]|uniref:Broad-complex core protein n=1 Tax=Stomoxys calcitrans TaxID=35570 RepID=A0A1I8PWL0_STOCA|nr:broad-complex core protein isoform X1 [Stomoxys calcitrans]
MDETQHFCLRWNNYQSSITSAFENLRDDEDFVDVTLACEGRSIKAHRVVLSACSPYFRDLLKSTPCKHPVILLQDVNFHDLHSLVEFIYHGEVNVHQKSLQSFLKTAEVLRVSGLTQQQAEETHSQLAQIQNLANSARTPLNPLHTPLHDESPLYQRNAASPPPPLPPTQMPFFKRGIGMLRRDHNNSTSSAEDPSNTLKRMRGPDNGLPPSNNNSPDIVHPRSTSPQLTPTDFSTMKHNNNNSPTPKDEKRNGSSTNSSGNGNGNGNGSANANANGNGNGITTGEKLGSLTPSPLARRAEDVKSEPMELVCSNNNEEHSNDSHGDNEQLRVGSVDCGKGSLSSGNDEEIENTMPSHQSSAPFLISPAESKLFPSAPFTFPMGNLDPAAFASLNSQMPSAADIAASPQGGSTNLLGGVIVPGVNANTSSNHHHSTHALHHEHHLHQANERSAAADEASETSERHQREPQSEREPSQQSSSFPNTPSPHHHHLHHHQQQLQQQSQSAQSPPPHSHAHAQFGLQQHPLSMLPTHHLHSHHDLSPSTHHHHHHLSRAPSPFDHHHLLQHRRSSLSPSPTGRSSNSSSAAGILASSRASELAGGNRLLLPLPLNACHRCDVCGKLLSTKLTLKRHKEQQHLQPLNNAVCNLCHKVFRTLNSLNNHKSIYHRRQKHHSYFHHASVGAGVGASSGAGSRLHQSLSSLSAAAAANSSATQRGNDNAVAAAAAAAAAAAELLLSPIVGAASVAGGSSGPTMQLSSHQQQSSPNIVKPCMDYL